jgi:hypothetical protein
MQISTVKQMPQKGSRTFALDASMAVAGAFAAASSCWVMNQPLPSF